MANAPDDAVQRVMPMNALSPRLKTTTIGCLPTMIALRAVDVLLLKYMVEHLWKRLSCLLSELLLQMM